MSDSQQTVQLDDAPDTRPSDDLAPVAAEVVLIRKRAESGVLRMDADTAQHLLEAIARIRSRVDELTVKYSSLDQRLQLGDSFVAHVMSHRLRRTAGGRRRAALPVLEAYGRVLADLEDLTRKAARSVTESDEDAGDLLHRAASGDSCDCCETGEVR